MSHEEDKYKNLIMTPSHKIVEWRDLVRSKIESGLQVAVIFDTETTGGVSGGKCGVIETVGKDMGKLHRVVEIGAVVTVKNEKTGLYDKLKDSQGEDVRFHEYINPWNENSERLIKTNTMDYMPFGAYNVHGISKNFLLGKEILGATLSFEKRVNFKLNRPAPVFSDVIDAFMDVTGLSHKVDFDKNQKNVQCIAYNAEFDNKFMNSELKMVGYSEFEAYCSPLCALILARDILPKSVVGSYTLDSVYSYVKSCPNIEVDEIPRDMHGGYVDSLILLNTLNGILQTPYVVNASNNPNSPPSVQEFIVKKIKQMDRVQRPLPRLKF